MSRAASRQVVLAADPLATASEMVAGRALVTPNDRAARALGRAGAASLQTRALRVLRSRGVQPAGTLPRLLVLRRVVAEVLGPADVKGTARRVAPVVSELLRVGLSARPNALAELEGARGVGRRSREVARLALAYSAALAERGEADPAELLWLAARAPLEPEPLLVGGYARLGEGELAFLSALAGPGSVAVLPRGFASSATAAGRLATDGWDVVTSDLVGPAPGPRLASRFTAAFGTAGAENAAPASGAAPFGPAGDLGEAEDPATAACAALRLANEEDEVRTVLARVKELLGSGVPAGRIVLVSRDERGYGPLVKAVGAEFGVPVRLAYGMPLRETRLGEAVAGLLEVVSGRLRFEETARLLRHPLTQALSEETWAAVRAGHPAGAEEWAGAGVEAAALLDWPAHASWDAYGEALRASLAGLGVAGRAAGRDRRALAKLLSSLRVATPLAGSAEAHETVTLGEYLGRVADVLDAASMPADPPARGAVELHTPLAVFGARYDHVFVLGLAEGVFPVAVAEDPVVDFHERRALAGTGLALEDAEGAAEREELSFLAVLHAAGASLTLTYAESFGGTERLPSPFLGAVGVAEPEVAAPRPAASGLEGLIAALPRTDGPVRVAWAVERRREGAEPPDLHDGVVGVPLPLGGPYSATQLTSFGQCSFRWFGEHGLGLREAEEAEDDVSPATAGSIYHQTLKLAVERARREVPRSGEAPQADPFRAAVLRHLPQAYDDAHEQLAAGGRHIRSRTWPLQRRENLEKLGRLVASADFVLPGARVSDLEVSFRGRWRGLSVRGFVDRIDVVSDEHGDSLVFTDYKLGSSAPKGAKGEKGALTLDVQLPLYVEAAAPALHPGLRVAAARYLSVNGAKVSKEVDPQDLDGAALDALVARFVDALEAGSFPLDPDPRQDACAYCAFDLVCRRGPRLSRKGSGDAEEEQREEVAA